jgi:hypothetical protein
MQDSTPPDKCSPLSAVGHFSGLKIRLTERNCFH